MNMCINDVNGIYELTNSNISVNGEEIILSFTHLRFKGQQRLLRLLFLIFNLNPVKRKLLLIQYNALPFFHPMK